MLRAIFAITPLLASGANAAGLSVHVGAPPANRLFVQTAETARPNAKGWSKLCFDVSSGRVEQKVISSTQTTEKQALQACYTYTVYRDPQLDILMYVFGVLETKEPHRSVFAGMLPIVEGPYPEAGFIRLDGNAEIKLSYLTPQGCDQSGCYSRGDMPEPLLEQLKAAKTISFSGPSDLGAKELGATLPCCGFSGALEGASVRPEAQDDTQRKIQEILRRNFADFMQ